MRGFSLVECLIVMLLASLLMILTVELQLVFFKQWRHQETLIEWQENQRLGYLLFKSWLDRLQAQYENEFELVTYVSSDSRTFLRGPWRTVLQQAKLDQPLLVAYSAGEIDSIWYISQTSGLFYKEKDMPAHELLTDVAGWQLLLENNQRRDTSNYLFSIAIQWEKPLQHWSVVSWQYAYTCDQELEDNEKTETV